MVGKTRTVLVVRYWYLSRLIELLWAAGLLFYTGAQVLVLSGVREDKYSPYAGGEMCLLWGWLFSKSQRRGQSHV